MPRGQYDRSKMKRKNATTEQAAPVAAPAARKGRPPKAAKAVAVTVQPGSIRELYEHLQYLSQTRSSLLSSQGHNEPLLYLVDGEIGETVKTLTRWREASFPAPIPAGTQVESPKVPEGIKKASAVIPTPIPVPISAPPLPFTPENVQQALKQQNS